MEWRVSSDSNETADELLDVIAVNFTKTLISSADVLNVKCLCKMKMKCFILKLQE